ncbi:MAG: hypothetical protein K2N48_12860 [Muribaculaceae bacterium]|nr:hypothetical protein [Muribaculaceae bacterium]
MSQVDCVNLLAFIQIAVAFDFGLLCLKDTHIFKDLHVDLLNELGDKVRPTRESLENKIEQLKNGSNQYQRKTQKPELEAKLRKLMYLVDSQQANWGKYGVIGLSAGIYGMLVLLIIGLKGSSMDSFFRDFLLIFAQSLLIWEGIALYQIDRIQSSQIPKMVMMKKLIVILGIIIFAGVMTAFDWSFRIFPNFQLPFIILTIVIVYLPVFVYLWKVFRQKRMIDEAEEDCREALRKNS